MLRLQEMFEDTKGVTGSRKSRTNRQHNGQKKKAKRNNNILQYTGAAGILLHRNKKFIKEFLGISRKML